MDFSLDRIRSACQKSHHSEIFKMLNLSSQNEPFVHEAFNRSCSICINMYLWRINFDEKIVRGSKRFSSKRRKNLLRRIVYFSENQEHINTLLNAFREERFEMLKDLFCSNESIVRNYAYQLAMERQLKENKPDALLLLLQWEKKQLEEKFNMYNILLEKSRFVKGLTSRAEVDPHFYVVSKLGEFMLRFDLPDTEPQQKKIKLDEKVPFVSEIYEQLKLNESVIVKKWFERKGRTSGKFFKDSLESTLLQFYRNAFKPYYAYVLLNYPSVIDEDDIRNLNLLEYVLSTPSIAISVETLRNIVKTQPSVVSWTKKETGDSILHVFVKTRTDASEIILFMVEELGLDPLRENNAKENALEYVLSTPCVGMSVEFLRNFVRAKPSVVNWVKEETGDSILHVFVKNRADSSEIVRFMVEELGLDPLRENIAKEIVLESFIRAKWSINEIYKSFENVKEILEYLESKSPLNGAEFSQKFSILSGFLMVYRAAYDKSPDQQFFLQYAMEKFYGPELNKDYPLIERLKEFCGQNHFYEQSPQSLFIKKDKHYYDVVALLHSIFDEDNFRRTLHQNKLNFDYFIQKSGPISFLNGRICDLIAKLYDESDENLKLFFEIIIKIHRIYDLCSTKFQTYNQTYNPILSCLPPYDTDSEEGFKKEHIERMIRVFNELISERNNACATIQEAIENWSIGVNTISTDFFNLKYNDLSDQDLEDTDQDIEDMDQDIEDMDQDIEYMVEEEVMLDEEEENTDEEVEEQLDEEEEESDSLSEVIHGSEAVPWREHVRFMKRMFRSGLFSVLYSFTCNWKFTLRDNQLSHYYYEELKMFLRKSEMFLPGSLSSERRRILPETSLSSRNSSDVNQGWLQRYGYLCRDDRVFGTA